MTPTLILILVVLGIVLLALQAFNVPSSRVQLGWLGLTVLAVALLLGQRMAL